MAYQNLKTEQQHFYHKDFEAEFSTWSNSYTLQPPQSYLWNDEFESCTVIVVIVTVTRRHMEWVSTGFRLN